VVYAVAFELEAHADQVVDTSIIGTKRLEQHFGSTREASNGNDRDPVWIHRVVDQQLADECEVVVTTLRSSPSAPGMMTCIFGMARLALRIRRGATLVITTSRSASDRGERSCGW
jgi:hypothetical protein